MNLGSKWLFTKIYGYILTFAASRLVEGMVLKIEIAGSNRHIFVVYHGEHVWNIMTMFLFITSSILAWAITTHKDNFTVFHDHETGTGGV